MFTPQLWASVSGWTGPLGRARQHDGQRRQLPIGHAFLIFHRLHGMVVLVVGVFDPVQEEIVPNVRPYRFSNIA